ncbi:MAG: ATP-binding protein [Bacteroidales bacterium]
MDLREYISNTYPTVGPFEGINSIENRLLKHQYLVVADQDKNFYGILTPSDIITHPHKIVVDCITRKKSLTVDDTAITTLEKFYSSQSPVLPVMNGNDFIGVIERNRVLKELEVKVNELYNKSLISQKAKIYFLNNLSHEIRTPLNSILGFLDIIANLNINDFTTEGNKNISNAVRKSAEHFLMVMGDLIELSLLHAGDEVCVNKENIDVVKILMELKDYFNELSLFQNKKVTVNYLNPESSFSIYTDGQKLKHILYHLIDNAIKFSEDNKIAYGFELKPNEKSVVFFVINKNSKIDQQDAMKMFEAFEKQEKIGSKLNFGLGIGLPLVKNLTELLGGHIKIESANNEIAFFVGIPIEQETASV